MVVCLICSEFIEARGILVQKDVYDGIKIKNMFWDLNYKVFKLKL